MLPKKRTPAQEARINSVTRNRYEQNIANIDKQLKRRDLTKAQKDALLKQKRNLQIYL